MVSAIVLSLCEEERTSHVGCTKSKPLMATVSSYLCSFEIRIY